MKKWSQTMRNIPWSWPRTVTMHLLDQKAESKKNGLHLMYWVSTQNRALLKTVSFQIDYWSIPPSSPKYSVIYFFFFFPDALGGLLLFSDASIYLPYRHPLTDPSIFKTDMSILLLNPLKGFPLKPPSFSPLSSTIFNWVVDQISQQKSIYFLWYNNKKKLLNEANIEFSALWGNRCL